MSTSSYLVLKSKSRVQVHCEGGALGEERTLIYIIVKLPCMYFGIKIKASFFPDADPRCPADVHLDNLNVMFLFVYFPPWHK